MEIYMFCEVTAATESGRIVGLILFWGALLAGALKCWTISRRPNTNTKCALSLMMILLAFMIAAIFGQMAKEVGGSRWMALLGAIAGLGMMGLLVAGAVLAILGLVEYSKRREVYTQGRMQAIWTLALTGFMCVLSVAGLIGRIQRVNGQGVPWGQNQPGQILTFDDLNFRFRSPDRPWFPYDASLVNKASKLAFTRRNPDACFFVIVEKVGNRPGFTTEQLAAIGKANLQAVAGSSHVVSEEPLQVNGLNGWLVKTEAQVGAYQMLYRQWYCFTNGYAYQLSGFSNPNGPPEVAADLEAMLFRFNLIDPSRVASVARGFTTNFYSQAHNYTVTLTNSAWHGYPDLNLRYPMANFGMSQGDSCLVVVPAHLGGQKIGGEALVAAFLATMDIAYPNENLVNERRLAEGDITGKQFDFFRELNGLTLHYRFKIVQRNGEGYLVAAWTQRSLNDAEPVLADALARVNFMPVSGSPPLSATSAWDDWHEKTASAYILNQAGLYENKQGDYEEALRLFRAAAQSAEQKNIYVLNALEAWQHLDRPKEVLDFLNTLPDTVLALPEVRANQALFQARAAMTTEAVTNYATLFAGGYRSDAHLAEYIDLLAEQHQYDTALTAVQAYRKAGDSVAVALLEAKVYRLQKDFPKAISVLKALRDQSPDDVQVSTALAETFIAAGQYADALAVSRELLKDDDSSAYYEYLKGRSEMGLKWYRESKISFAEAARLAPANKEIRSYLDYVSGLLGEGDNTAVMDPIEAVALPAVLTNLPPETVPPDDVTNYGAYYERRIVATSFDRGHECKTSEFTLARILAPSGVSAFSTVQIVFDPLSEQVYVNEVRVMDARGNTISTGNPDNYYVLDNHSDSATSASQMKVLNIPVPGLQPGCQMAVTTTRKQLSDLEKFNFCAHSFASVVPVRTSVFLLVGTTHDLKYQTSPAMAPEKVPGGLCWRIDNPMVARWEPLQPPLASFLPMLWISDAGADWPGMVSNYLASISDRLEPDPALKSLAQTLVANVNDAGAKTALLARYVQTNLTYNAIEFGRRALIPNKPALVLANKYGDCKDHAVLLRQMLVEAGVPSQLALVSHRGPIQKNQPSLDQFDHMIVYVPGVRGGQFLDCTSKGSDVANSIPAGLAGQEALVLDPVNPHFVTIPAYSSTDSSVSVEQHFQLADRTDLLVDESVMMAGVYAAGMRDYLLKIPETSRRTSLQTIMGMADANLTDLQIDSLNEPGKPLRLRFTYSLKHQFRYSENRLSGILPAGFARSYIAANPVDRRRTPFEINVPTSIDFKQTFEAPPGFEAAQPEGVEPDLDPRFATGQGNATAKGATFNSSFSCQLKTGKFEAASYDVFRQTMSQALSFIEREVVFNADGH